MKRDHVLRPHAGYPDTALTKAWKYLRANHAHDSISGASTDAVCADVVSRFTQCEQMTAELTRRALSDILSRIDDPAVDDGDVLLTVFNPLPFPRDEVVCLDLDLSERDASDFHLCDARVNAVPYHADPPIRMVHTVHQTHGFPYRFSARRHRLWLRAESIPAMGYATYLVKKGPCRAVSGMAANGIELPAEWPPRNRAWSMEPIGRPPYVVSPPAVIPVDIGRQLFVDDFLIEKTSLKRSFHAAEPHPGNPVFEGFPYSDGIWYDPRDQLFKMWYMGDSLQREYATSLCTRYATSKDGIHWERPSLDFIPGTNIVFKVPAACRDSSTTWLDLDEKDPNRRYKMIVYLKGPEHNYCSVHFSADGIHWGDSVAKSGRCGDTTSAFWNPFRKVWVYSAKDPHVPQRTNTIPIETGALKGRQQRVKRRLYWEARDLVKDSAWADKEIPYWIGADRLDLPRPDLGIPTMLYRLDCVAYESLILGLFTIWHGQHDARPKINDLVAGFSRDGFHWDRTNREPLMTVSEKYGDWNWGNVSSVGGCCLIVGEKLYFYVAGRSGEKNTPNEGKITTGLATLRRDGFASMDAGNPEGKLTTRLISFKGEHLFVNVDAPQGELRVEVLDRQDRAIEPFTQENCTPVTADKTLQMVSWKGAEDLSGVSGRPVRFRFHLSRGRLYAFWVSPDKSGAGHGYVAAGGPGFTGPTDTSGG